MIKKTRSLALALICAACASACAGKSASGAPPQAPPSAPAPVADDANDALMEHHRYHHHGGVTLFIAMSLDTLGVSPERHDRLEKIRLDLHQRMLPAQTAEQNLVNTLADGLQNSDLDSAKVDAAVAQVTSAAALVRDASADALNDLHALLTPLERATLVQKVEAHWAVWQRSNTEESSPELADDGHLAALTRDLQLSPDQVAKTRATLDASLKTVARVDPKQVSAQLEAFGATFQNETFNAKGTGSAANVENVDARLAGWGAAYLAHVVEALGPILRPAQREKLVQRLHQHAAHNPSAEASL